MTAALRLDVPRTQQIVGVRTTAGRGFSAEELASQCVEKIVSISDTTHPALRDQAREFSVAIEKVIAHYMRQAIHSDRTTVYSALNDAGHPDLAELIRRL
jgi:hypothetical protein